LLIPVGEDSDGNSEKVYCVGDGREMLIGEVIDDECCFTFDGEDRSKVGEA